MTVSAHCMVSHVAASPPARWSRLPPVSVSYIMGAASSITMSMVARVSSARMDSATRAAAYLDSSSPMMRWYIPYHDTALRVVRPFLM